MVANPRTASIAIVAGLWAASGCSTALTRPPETPRPAVTSRSAADAPVRPAAAAQALPPLDAAVDLRELPGLGQLPSQRWLDENDPARQAAAKSSP